MAMLLTIVLFINNTFVHDCSAIFDFKEHAKKQKHEAISNDDERTKGFCKDVDRTKVDNCYVNESMTPDEENISENSTPRSTSTSSEAHEDDSVASVVNDLAGCPSPPLFNVKKVPTNLHDMNHVTVDVEMMQIRENPENAISKTFYITSDEADNNSSDRKDLTSEPQQIINQQPQQQQQQQQKEQQHQQQNSRKHRKHIPLTTVLKVLFTNTESAIVLCSSLVFMYVLFAFDLLLPMIITITFKWPIKVVMFAYLGYGVLTLLVLITMSWGCTKGRGNSL